jgi:tetratricopeptide (TPR) repeat protein
MKVLLPELAAEPTSPEQVQYTPERLQALADTALAHEEKGFGSDKEAYAHTQEAVKLYPDSPVTHYYRGEVLLGPVHSAEAKAEYQKAVELGDDATVAAAKKRIEQFR